VNLGVLGLREGLTRFPGDMCSILLLLVLRRGRLGPAGTPAPSLPPYRSSTAHKRSGDSSHIQIHGQPRVQYRYTASLEYNKDTRPA